MVKIIVGTKIIYHITYFKARIQVLKYKVFLCHPVDRPVDGPGPPADVAEPGRLQPSF